ncbi:MAG: hypothetical protein ACRD3F_07310 [Acidobacteriaceae bacterium]
MKKWSHRITLGILSCCLAVVLPALAQDNHPQTDEHSDHHSQTNAPEHRTQRPEETQHRGATPAQHNTAHPEQNRTAYPQQNRTVHPEQNRGARPEQNRTAYQSHNRGSQHRAGHGQRPAQWGRPPARRGSYSFRSNDRARLHSYYMSRMRAINRANRPVFRVGGYFPYVDIEYLSPLPPDLYGTLPPPPPGYQMGYYDGYVIVFDPVTGYIVSVIDLLQ